MSEQTTEERAAEGVNALLIKVEGLEADVGILERRRKEAEDVRDSLKAQVQEWMEGSAQLQVKLDEMEKAAHHLEWLLRAHAELVPPDHDKDWDQWMVASYQDSLKAAQDFIAAGLSTVTPEDWAGHLRERAEGGGKTVEELREKYRRDTQTCERVSTFCARTIDRHPKRLVCFSDEEWKCATHHGPFPVGTKRCPAALTGNVT